MGAPAPQRVQGPEPCVVQGQSYGTQRSGQPGCRSETRQRGFLFSKEVGDEAMHGGIAHESGIVRDKERLGC